MTRKSFVETLSATVTIKVKRPSTSTLIEKFQSVSLSPPQATPPDSLPSIKKIQSATKNSTKSNPKTTSSQQHEKDISHEDTTDNDDNVRCKLEDKFD